MESGNYAHFHTLQENKPTSSTPFVSVIRDLKTEFLCCFGGIRSLENDIKFFSTPFDVQVGTVQEKYQLKLVELQCSNHLKSKFHAEGVLLLDFYKKYLECKQYPNFINHAKEMASMFDSTYVCEQLFLCMKVTKRKLKTQLNDGHL